MSETKAKREPGPLSTEYHKARKQLMLWAGILFIWELVGIDLERAKEAGGNAGALIAAIKSPQAVPWVLLILVSYFLFKCSIEWAQCNAVRRSLRVSKIDFISAWIVSLAAFGLYFGQTMSRVQLADNLKDPVAISWFFSGLITSAGLTATTFVMAVARARSESPWRSASRLILITLLGTFALLTLAAVSIFKGTRTHWTVAIAAIVIGVLGVAILISSLRPWQNWPYPAEPKKP